jgi:hypothetical protein
VSLPVGSMVVEIRAVTPVSGTEVEFPPITKVTLPVGVAPPGALPVTIAVKVTDWPAWLGFDEDCSEIAELALSTIWLRFVELVVKLLSPL